MIMNKMILNTVMHTAISETVFCDSSILQTTGVAVLQSHLRLQADF